LKSLTNVERGKIWVEKIRDGQVDPLNHWPLTELSNSYLHQRKGKLKNKNQDYQRSVMQCGE
jgi:hypothetical protein